MDSDFHKIDWDEGVGRRRTSREQGGRIASKIALIAQVFEAERSRWFLWVPVLLAAGIASYFSLPIEPPIWAIVTIGLFAKVIFVFRLCGHRRLVLTMLAIFLAGICIGKLRVETSGPGTLILPSGVVSVTGVVQEIQARPRGGSTLIMIPNTIENVAPDDLPAKIRLIWRGADVPLRAGVSVSLRARFLSRHKPAWPGGYDSGFAAWFHGIGAQGFAISGPEIVADNQLTLLNWLQNVRMSIAHRVLQALPNEAGALAVALITGQRGYLSTDVTDALRASGLAHLLAISGLHMGLFAGGVFWLLRSLLALSPALAVNYPIKKWAATAAIAGGLIYLFISGMGIATQRAFVMISIMFIAVLTDRPALSMRNVTLAALVILVMRPESIMTVSFHMSFLAVVCLIAVYEWYADWKSRRDGGRYQAFYFKACRYIGGLALTTFVAGMATAPIAAYQFNRVALFSVIANVIALPAVGLIVMPMAVIGLILMPFGLESYALGVMEAGISAVMMVARHVAGMPDSIRMISQQSLLKPMLIVSGLLWTCLWIKSWRYAGLGLAFAGAVLVQTPALPDVLIGADGKLIGIKADDGALSLNTAKSEKFLGERWLRKFGDPSSPEIAAARGGISCDTAGCIGALSNGFEIALVKHPSILREECVRAQIVVVAFRYKGECPSARLMITQTDLRREGVHAIYLADRENKHAFNSSDKLIKLHTAASSRGLRPWSVREKWIPAPERRRRVNPSPKKKKQPDTAPSENKNAPHLQIKI